MSARLLRIKDWEELAQQAKFQPGVMASLCPISLRQLERFFVLKYQMTPNRWTRELRFRLAKQLMAEGWSSKAVAEELGFANASHFCHEFKRFYVVAPQTFAPMHGGPSDANTLTPMPRKA